MGSAPSRDAVEALQHCLDRLVRISYETTRRASEVPVAEFATLSSIVDSPGSSAVSIAVQRGLNRSTISRQLSALRRRGLVRIEDEAGRYRLTATAEGAAVVDRARSRLSERIAERVGGWAETDIRALTDLIGAYLDADTGRPSAPDA